MANVKDFLTSLALAFTARGHQDQGLILLPSPKLCGCCWGWRWRHDLGLNDSDKCSGDDALPACLGAVGAH